VTTARPLRADAQQNRDAIVAAAREVFGEQGLEAPLGAVARRAGVGSATLYRRFGSKTELVAEAFRSELEAYAELIQEGLDDPDPWRGFVHVLLRVCEAQATDRALADLITRASPLVVPTSVMGPGSAKTHELVRRAHESGDLRADFTAQDIVLVFLANAGLSQRTFVEAPDSWRRIVAFLIDGLRAESAHEDPGQEVSEIAVWRVMNDN